MIQWYEGWSEMTKCLNMICTCNMVRWQWSKRSGSSEVVMLRSINWLINVHRHYVDREGLTTSLSSQHQQQSKQDFEWFYLLTAALATGVHLSSRDSPESAVNRQNCLTVDHITGPAAQNICVSIRIITKVTWERGHNNALDLNSIFW